MAEDTGQTSDLATGYRLPQGRMLRIQRALGWVLHCDDGAIHLTQQGDARDIVLRAGAALVLNTNGRVVLDAHGDARLRLAPPAAAAIRAGWRRLLLLPAAASSASPVVRLLAAHRHGVAPASGLPPTYDAVFRAQPDGSRLLDVLVARAHHERSEMIAATLVAAMSAVASIGVGAVRGVFRIGVVAGLALCARLRLQLPSLAETFAARVLLRTRMWH